VACLHPGTERQLLLLCGLGAQDKTVTFRCQLTALAAALGTIMGFTGFTNIGVARAVASPRGSARPASPSLGRQMAELAGSGSGALDWFGASVAVSGNTIVVGAPAEPLLSAGVGRAYVFTKTTTGWHQSAELHNPDPLGPDWFGDSVAVSGNTIVVGAPAISILSSGLGRAYVFTKTATGWRESGQLEGPGTTVGDWFGDAVAVSARTVVVGAPSHDAKAGAAYVFTNFGQSWRAMQLKGSDTVAKDAFGGSVAVAGNTIVVGAFGHASEAGRAYVFTKRSQGWDQAAELSGSDTVAGDAFGDSVAVGGRMIAVGAGLAASDAGRVYLFTRKTSGWHQSAELAGSDNVAKEDDFGDSVAVSGDSVVVGTFAQGSRPGLAYLFTRTPEGWRQAAELASGAGTTAGNEFGYSVAVSGDTIAVGARGQDSGAGRAYLFEV
jgi:FG-GAP repeat